MSTQSMSEWTDLKTEVRNMRVAEQIAKEQKGSGNGLVDAMDASVPNARTENGAYCFESTRCSRLDLFFSLLRDATPDKILPLLAKAWAENPAHAVQIVMHARDCRGGKGEKEVSLMCLLWLRQHKPRTYQKNLRHFLDVGYYKDLLNLALRAQSAKLPKLSVKTTKAEEQLMKKTTVNDSDAGAEEKKSKEDEEKEKERAKLEAERVAKGGEEQYELELFAADLASDYAKWTAWQEKKKKVEGDQKKGKDGQKDGEKEKAKEKEKEKQPLKKKKGDEAEKPKKTDEFEDDDDAVLVELEDREGENDDLNTDDSKEMKDVAPASSSSSSASSTQKRGKKRKPMKGGKSGPHTRKETLELSLAAKWAPTERSHFDQAKNGNMAYRLARLIFPGVDPKKVKVHYRKLLSPLREHLRVVERMMCARQWNRIRFSAVPSRAHHLLKKTFMKHDQARYQKYLELLKVGKAKINTQGVMPHELVAQYMAKGDFGEIANVNDLDLTIEGQWKTMVDKLCANGKLGKCLAISDVSGSMHGVPIQVSIALGLIISLCSTGPFHRRLLTFSNRPEWHKVEGDNLRDMVKSVHGMAWEMNTDLMKVFRLILSTAVDNKVKAEDMPSMLFILSDMQFDQATNNADHKSTHDIIMREYNKAGYQPPQIVYWNLRASTVDFPIGSAHTPGVAMVSGFSADLIKLFLDNEALTPMSILLKSIIDYPAEIDAAEVDKMQVVEEPRMSEQEERRSYPMPGKAAKRK